MEPVGHRETNNENHDFSKIAPCEGPEWLWQPQGHFKNVQQQGIRRRTEAREPQRTYENAREQQAAPKSPKSHHPENQGRPGSIERTKAYPTENTREHRETPESTRSQTNIKGIGKKSNTSQFLKIEPSRYKEQEHVFTLISLHT